MVGILALGVVAVVLIGLLLPLHDVMWLYGVVSAVWLAGCLLTFLWGVVRRWEMDILLPVAAGVYGAAGFGITFLISLVVNDHLHLTIGAR